MPTEYTKKEIDKLLKEERDKQKLKNKQSKFMSRTLSIYNGQKARCKELTGKSLTYTLEDLRELVKKAIDTKCPYSGEKLTLNSLAVDHAQSIASGGSFDFDNLQVISQKSNFRKGQLTSTEYMDLIKFVEERLSPKSREDLFRRLVIGGKWSFK